MTQFMKLTVDGKYNTSDREFLWQFEVKWLSNFGNIVFINLILHIGIIEHLKVERKFSFWSFSVCWYVRSDNGRGEFNIVVVRSIRAPKIDINGIWSENNWIWIESVCSKSISEIQGTIFTRVTLDLQTLPKIGF